MRVGLPGDVDFRAEFEGCAPEALEMLRRQAPSRVVRELQRRGWPRGWACELVERLEREHNPAGLTTDRELNNWLPERHSFVVVFGGAAILLGWALVVLSTGPALGGGGVNILADGAIVRGVTALWRGILVLRRYPDRRIPGCRGPDGKLEAD